MVACEPDMRVARVRTPALAQLMRWTEDNLRYVAVVGTSRAAKSRHRSISHIRAWDLRLLTMQMGLRFHPKHLANYGEGVAVANDEEGVEVANDEEGTEVANEEEGTEVANDEEGVAVANDEEGTEVAFEISHELGRGGCGC